MIAGVCVVAFVTMSGAGALQAAGFGPASPHDHGSGSPTASGSDGRAVTDLTTAPTR